MKTIKFMLVIFSLLIMTPVSADIYKYVNAKGQVYYTDEPTHGKYKRVVRSASRINSYSTANYSRSSYSRSIKSLKKNKHKYASTINAAAAKHQLDPKLLHAMIYAESAYNPSAVSSAGAVGMMQLMPATAKRYGVTNRRDPTQNINAGARYMKDLLKMFNADLRLAIAAYNAGEGAVKKYRNTVPPYRETRNYVKKVLALYRGQA